MDFEVTDEAFADDVAVLDAGLTEDTRALGIHMRPLYVMAREGGQLIGGVRARIVTAVLYTKWLWVANDHRKAGLGRSLMERVEQEAVKLGCNRAVVDTMSYQVPDFYRKIGYEQIVEIPNLFDGYDCFFMEKNLKQSI